VAHATRAGIGVEFKNTSPYLMQIIGLLVDRMEE
jgi:hypothetical protein